MVFWAANFCITLTVNKRLVQSAIVQQARVLRQRGLAGSNDISIMQIGSQVSQTGTDKRCYI